MAGINFIFIVIIVIMIVVIIVSSWRFLNDLQALVIHSHEREQLYHVYIMTHSNFSPYK